MPTKTTFLLLIFLMLFSYGINAQENIQADSIRINMDTDIFLEYTAGINNDYIFKKVDIIADSSRTIKFHLSYKKDIGSLLLIQNPSDYRFIFKAFLYNYKSKQYEETSIVPVMRKIMSVEMWPVNLDHIMLTGYKLLKGD